jgi:hypothetical protein
MCGAIPLLPQNVFMAWFLVKHRDNFTFTLHKTRKLEAFITEYTCSWGVGMGLLFTQRRSSCPSPTDPPFDSAIISETWLEDPKKLYEG